MFLRGDHHQDSPLGRNSVNKTDLNLQYSDYNQITIPVPIVCLR